ncbi:MAG: Translation initiation factor 5A [Methanonatronarchaeales archaeon]|nr:Translation initiation factor 5A [Methanonatronarchaeales archaeon]
MATERTDVRSLKEGRYVVIEDEPCRIKKIQISQPGKHGSAKARVSAVGVFDDKKRSFIKSVNDKVEVPIIEREKGQVVSIAGDTVQIMNLSTYQTFDAKRPGDRELSEGEEITYLAAMDRRKILD